jgi:tetratricopeptide (TPR) repeat protein
LFQKYSQDLLEPVAVTWWVSFEKLQTENPAALDLLYLIANLAPDNIPRDLLQSTAKTPIEFNKAVESLRRYSLIETGDGMISVHRLVQKVVRDQLAAQEKQEEWAEKAVGLVNDAFPTQSDKYANWPACSRLLAHARAAADQAEELEVGLEDTSRLLNELGLHLGDRARFDEAEELLRRSLRISNEVSGIDDDKVATILNNIGTILGEKGDLEGALRFGKQALRIAEKTYGTNHPLVGIFVNSVGQVLMQKGDLKGALRFTKRSFRIREAAFGSESTQVATAANNIGQILQDTGDLDGARE